ncbi:MAG: ABC transporter substrate-binding protein, partial [Phascolarctobacterium sp.]
MKSFKLNALLLLSLLMIFTALIVGCGRGMKEAIKEKELYSVIDATGTRVNFVQKPHRIVSLSISTDEILLDLVPAKHITALTKYADDAGISNVVERARAIEGRVQDTNPESILALKPDLILMPDFTSRDTIESLREMHLPVYVYKAPYDMKGIRAC